MKEFKAEKEHEIFVFDTQEEEEVRLYADTSIAMLLAFLKTMMFKSALKNSDNLIIYSKNFVTIEELAKRADVNIYISTLQDIEDTLGEKVVFKETL